MQNPYNPHKFKAAFSVNVIEEAKFMQLKEGLKSQGVKGIDKMVVLEGCINDDKTVLGGQMEFLSHFCTLF